MTRPWQATWDKLRAHAAELACLESASQILEWDERTYMPPQAGPYRSQQLTLMAGLIHQRRTAPEVGDWLAELHSVPEGTLPPDVLASIRWMQRDYDRQTRLPQSLVEALARAVSRGQQVWEVARKNNDYAALRPELAEIIRLKREQSAALGPASSPYDPLLDEYEPGATVSWLTPLLLELRQQIVPLVDAIIERQPSRPRTLTSNGRNYPIEQQRQLGCLAASEFGFDFQRGRLDVTHHPFCLTAGPFDCRITTRYDEHDFTSALYSILHETGHGLYEQGLPAEQFGLPLGSAASLGVHESQSRLWENFVGRHPSYWRHLFPVAQRYFPDSLAGVTRQQLCDDVNRVERSLIRVEADEVTYNLHIVIRFELERELISGALDVDDLPAAWNKRYVEYFKLRPANDAEGVMQDVHWPAGLFGYFPTYTLGNLYAAMLWDAIRRDLGDIERLLAAGEFAPILEWLRDRIHRQGRRHAAPELIEQACGQPPSSQPLVGYLRAKYLESAAA